MNHCVIGLGSNSGPNLHDGSMFCGQKQVCVFRAPLQTLALPKGGKKNTQESQSLEFFVYE